jgi:hypothetical protein
LGFDKGPESPNFQKKSIYLTDRMNNILHGSYSSQQNIKSEFLSDDSQLKKKPAKLKRDKAKRNLDIPSNTHRGNAEILRHKNYI